VCVCVYIYTCVLCVIEKSIGYFTGQQIFLSILYARLTWLKLPTTTKAFPYEVTRKSPTTQMHRRGSCLPTLLALVPQYLAAPFRALRLFYTAHIHAPILYCNLCANSKVTYYKRIPLFFYFLFLFFTFYHNSLTQSRWNPLY